MRIRKSIFACFQKKSDTKEDLRAEFAFIPICTKITAVFHLRHALFLFLL